MFVIKDLKFKDILNIKELVIDRQVTCLVGPSGSGKTTLLRMLNRLNDADSGEIFYQGKSIQDIDAVQLRRKVVMLGQTPVIYSGTIEDNLQIGLKLSHQSLASKERMYEYLKKVHLDKKLNDTCEKLSGGEKQRLCLARVLLMNAEVYLADEPSSALDKETEQFVIEQLVNYVLEHDKQLIMVTHSEEISRRYFQGVLLLENGMSGGYVHE